ncbi:MAG: S8 family serine peptidase, partial [Nitrosopumilaceae archaeon]
TLYHTYILDRIIQRENIAFVCSAGNIHTSEIMKDIISGKNYPDYLKKYFVISPASAISSIGVGSLAKNNSSKGNHPNSIAKEGEISPYSCCGTNNVALFECRKPDLVEHGGNLNRNGSMVSSSGLSGISSYTKDGNRTRDLFGTSFSSPLLARKLAEIEAKYKTKINNIETLKAISFISCMPNQSLCAGYGEPISFTGCSDDHALFLSEGIIPLSDKTEKGKTVKYSDEIYIKVPNSSIEKITLCLVHSDDYHWEQIPALNTYMVVEARKTGSDSIVPPISSADINKKTNVKILSYSFDQKSMEATWRFNLIPELTKRIPPKYRKQTNVRYGCAILLSRKDDRASKYSVTEQVKAVK